MAKPVTYPVNDASRVNILEASQDLIHQELHVLVRQRLRLENVVQVGTHQVSDKISATRPSIGRDGIGHLNFRASRKCC